MGFAKKDAKHFVHAIIYKLDKASDAQKLKRELKKLAAKYKGAKLTYRRKGKRPK